MGFLFSGTSLPAAQLLGMLQGSDALVGLGSSRVGDALVMLQDQGCSRWVWRCSRDAPGMLRVWRCFGDAPALVMLQECSEHRDAPGEQMLRVALTVVAASLQSSRYKVPVSEGAAELSLKAP